jgi:hypothetical protein
LKNEMNTIRLVNESLRKRYSGITLINKEIFFPFQTKFYFSN